MRTPDLFLALIAPFTWQGECDETGISGSRVCKRKVLKKFCMLFIFVIFLACACYKNAHTLISLLPIKIPSSADYVLMK